MQFISNWTSILNITGFNQINFSLGEHKIIFSITLKILTSPKLLNGSYRTIKSSHNSLLSAYSILHHRQWLQVTWRPSELLWPTWWAYEVQHWCLQKIWQICQHRGEGGFTVRLWFFTLKWSSRSQICLPPVWPLSFRCSWLRSTALW